MAQKNDKRNQHYVPKCYLRNFSDNDEFIATFMHSKINLFKMLVLIVLLSENTCTEKIWLLKISLKNLRENGQKLLKQL